jgi:DNA-binding NarL/FixJ family response regulator
VLVEDRGASPAEIALTRIDFEAWVATLAPRQQTVASALAESYTLTEIAMNLNVTVGRVSQIRKELARSWDKFHGEVDDLMCAELANNPAHS